MIDPNLKDSTQAITTYISEYFGWYYLLIIMVFLAFCIYLIFSRIGKLRLGKDNERPEYSTASWFAMLFSAGMGMGGLVFWTTAEPISHAFKSSPNAEVGSNEAIRESLQYSFFHWGGIHAWAVYAIVALALAYFKFKKIIQD